MGLAPNKNQAVSASNIQATLDQYSNLQDVVDDHRKTRLNKYFYTEEYGWIDFKHFSESARLIAEEHMPDWAASIGGVGMEAFEDLVETVSNSDYKSGWSYEDLVSNRAGREFGHYVGQYDGNLGKAFEAWRVHAGAMDITEDGTGAPLGDLPDSDPARKPNLQKGFSDNVRSTPDENHPPSTWSCRYIGPDGSYECKVN